MTGSSPPPAILLMGPTAVGKTELALALVRRLPLEIVSVDSAQVYRGMDIGTAKPPPEALARAPHHLIDIVEPSEPYSAGRFRKDALRVMREITGRGRVPLLVGGTMLYFRALREGLAPMPPADPALRASIDREAARRGWPALHAELGRLDPAAARRIHPNDAQRIQRALEVVRSTGRPLSRWQAAPARPLPYRTLSIALVPADRGRLHARIRARFLRMVEAGFLAEVRRLRARGDLRAVSPSMRCVGYRQAWAHLEGALSDTEWVERGIVATRQLARRQLTWLRATSADVVVDPWDDRAAPSAIDRIIERHLR